MSGWSAEPIGVDLATLPSLRGRRVLALRQTVNPIVEEHDFELNIPAQCVDEMIATNAQPVAVTRDQPDMQVGSGDLESGCNRRCPTMNGMKAIGIHVVRETTRTADPRNENRFFFWNAELREDFLDLSQNGIIPTARTPTDVLV